MNRLSHQRGFTIVELLVTMTIMLLVVGGALTTFQQALAINDAGMQLADANQNLRAGTNQLIRDLLMAGRIIGAEGISMPTGAGIVYKRPGPANLNFDLVTDGDPTLQLPSISTGDNLGPTINGQSTDIVTIMTVDEFMPVITTPPSGTSPATEGTIAPDGTYVTVAAGNLWLTGDTVNDTPKIQVGDLVLFKSQFGTAIQTVTRIDTTRIYFDSSAPDNAADFFRFNQPNATIQPVNTGRPLAVMKDKNLALAATAAWPATSYVTLFKALMITYYVDNTTLPTVPRLTRIINNFSPQALAGIVEDLDLTYDLKDGATNPTNISTLPFTMGSPAVTYNASQIRKVNVHVGVRSQTISKPTQDYVRNHISTSVEVRSLASADRYKTQ